MEPKKDVVEKGRSVRDMHHLRLMSLLQELERDNGRKKAAEVLGSGPQDSGRQPRRECADAAHPGGAGEGAPVGGGLRSR